MLDVIVNGFANSLDDQTPSRSAERASPTFTVEQVPVHAAAWLSAGLSGAWDVTLSVDPDGETSVVVAPVDDDPATPSYILFQKDGQAWVGTVKTDAWQSEQRFTTYEDAVAAIVSAAWAYDKCRAAM